MGKYLIHYLVFWLPAIITAYCLSGEGTAAQIIQWFCAFFMLIGWGINTGMAAYHYPYSTLTALFVYSGFNVLAASIVYVTDYRSGTHIVLRAVGGFLSYKPLERIWRILQAFSVPAELITIAILTGVCLIGWLVGITQRRVSPDPYSPRMIRRQ